ncbi:transposase [Caldifermentibacillus hisashii]|uniref:transposase n=1 Tax=Caldifermentibacillus hisashii TaxID=996558 RepID=UPI000BA4720B|nr:transposase [Caldifermentibacillus hisashii]
MDTENRECDNKPIKVEVSEDESENNKEFKIQTVKMIQEQGKPVAQVARELGVSDNTLYRWINEFKQDPTNAFRGSGNLKIEEKTILDMQKRIRQLEMENEILKKAMHIFAKDRN